MLKNFLFIAFLFGTHIVLSQNDPIKLFKQFNGRYSYTAIGNTLNENENNLDKDFCRVLDSSSASLNLNTKSKISAAYIYWAGSGMGDKKVTLKTFSKDSIATDSIQIKAEKTYNVKHTSLPYFSCFSDITPFFKKNKNSIYQLSNLDINDLLKSNESYCNNATNFAGWCIYIVYKNKDLPLNQVNLFQGLTIINRDKQKESFTLDNINVIDNKGAKIGFLAWEGDDNLNYGESLSLNGVKLSNELNKENNAFNGTNSFAKDSLSKVSLYNMDMDVYDIENIINKGDTSIKVELTTGEKVGNDIKADLIILNNIITVFNSQLPDATIKANTIITDCYKRTINLDYAVYNKNATDILPANTPIAFYVNNEVLIGQSETKNIIPIDGFESGNIKLTIPENIEEDFNLFLKVDDNGNGESTVIEIIENNNTDVAPLLRLPRLLPATNIKECDKGYNTSIFNLNDAITPILYKTYSSFKFYSTEDNLDNDIEIINPEQYTSKETPETIYVKAEHPDKCYDILSFDLLTKNCPPRIPSGYSPNNDGKNDYFNIQGLYTIFENHELLIYNRYGTLIFKGNDASKWYGTSNQGINNVGNPLPVGTYFYVLNLNDSNYKPLTGWVYLNK